MQQVYALYEFVYQQSTIFIYASFILTRNGKKDLTLSFSDLLRGLARQYTRILPFISSIML